MAESLYSMLSEMLLNEDLVKRATSKAREKIKKSYDANVRRPMVQYYLDQYDPKKYKRQKNSPLFLAYKSHSKLINNGLSVDVWTERTGIDLGDYYSSRSYYHRGDGDDTGDDDNVLSGSWREMRELHNITGKQYMLNMESLREEYGQDNGTVMGSWILDNFEKGIHPRTNGWPRKKRVSKMKYMPKQDPITPLQMLEVYAGDFTDMDMPYQYIYSEMFKEWKKVCS